jgi:hypothetical protein
VDLGLAAVPSAYVPAAVDFGTTAPGAPVQRAIKLINNGGGTMHVSGAAVSGAGFTSTSDCSAAVLTRGHFCTVTATFNPSSTSTYSGTLTFTDDSYPLVGTASTSTQVVQLTGAGSADFSISASPRSQTISSGHSAKYTVTVTSLGFAGNVNLSCAGGPPHSTCSVSPNTATLTGSGSSSVKATVSLFPPKNVNHGTFSVTVTGTAGALVHSARVSLTIK